MKNKVFNRFNNNEVSLVHIRQFLYLGIYCVVVGYIYLYQRQMFSLFIDNLIVLIVVIFTPLIRINSLYEKTGMYVRMLTRYTIFTTLVFHNRRYFGSNQFMPVNIILLLIVGSCSLIIYIVYQLLHKKNIKYLNNFTLMKRKQGLSNTWYWTTAVHLVYCVVFEELLRYITLKKLFESGTLSIISIYILSIFLFELYHLVSRYRRTFSWREFITRFILSTASFITIVLFDNFIAGIFMHFVYNQFEIKNILNLYFIQKKNAQKIMFKL